VRVVENIKPLEKAGATIVVATDHQDIVEVCEKFGINCRMTKVDHPSGTDRCQEVAADYHHPFILNVQGDEPTINTDDLMALAKTFESHSFADMATLVFETQDTALITNPNVVKVVANRDQFALYFSRAPIPYFRDPQESGTSLIHLGTYAFRRQALTRFCALPQGMLEATEKLEQLRALENGLPILLVKAKVHGRGIDTPEDLEAARALFQNHP
jgi:3-deoxy-manno-octulosonate cytidylyltransferase (CMP-KDO synthetase)